jgi:YggT family protein
MKVLVEVLVMALDVYKWALIVMIVFSWLIAFNVINTRNQFVASVWQVLNAITEPVLRPIRRYMPRMQIDLSPIVLFLAIYLIQELLMRYVWPMVP